MPPVSLRLGHAAALTCHWHVIHSRGDASLPSRGRHKGAAVRVSPLSIVHWFQSIGSLSAKAETPRKRLSVLHSITACEIAARTAALEWQLMLTR